MNKRIKNINIEDILFFDIETVRQSDVLDVASEQYKVFRYKNRNKEDNSLLDEELVLTLYNKRAALSPVYGKIVCISVAMVKNSKVTFKSFTGDEASILTSFYNIWKNKPTLIPCGYNIARFDLPFTRIRASVLGVEFTEKFNDSEAKPWILAENVIDLMEVITGCLISNFSLEEVCTLFGVESPKNTIDGSMVSDVYYKEGVTNIASYCERDVVAVVEVFNKIAGLNLSLTYAPKEELTQTIFDLLLKAKALTPKVEQELLKVKAKYLDKTEELSKVKTLLLAAVGKKALDIKEFINNL